MIGRIFLTALASMVWTLCASAQVSRPALPEDRDLSETLRALLSVPEADIDLTWSKLVIDTLIDPEADIEEGLAKIDSIAARVQQLAGEDASAARRVAFLRAYIYEAGPWNDHQPYSYDFDDPSGMMASHKSLNRYLTTQRGNCINMPFLFLVVGERMGIEMNVTTAPRHVFVQFEDPITGEVQHLETTSGAQPQRIVWQRHVLPMTDRSIESGMYMQRLSKRQQITVMAEALLQLAREQGDHVERLELAALILEQFPQSDFALLNVMDASRSLIQREILPKHPHPNEMPSAVLRQFEEWAMNHDGALDALQSYGWQPAVQNENVILPGEGRSIP